MAGLDPAAGWNARLTPCTMPHMPRTDGLGNDMVRSQFSLSAKKHNQFDSVWAPIPSHRTPLYSIRQSPAAVVARHSPSQPVTAPFDPADVRSVSRLAPSVEDLAGVAKWSHSPWMQGSQNVPAGVLNWCAGRDAGRHGAEPCSRAAVEQPDSMPCSSPLSGRGWFPIQGQDLSFGFRVECWATQSSQRPNVLIRQEFWTELFC